MKWQEQCCSTEEMRGPIDREICLVREIGHGTRIYPILTPFSSSPSFSLFFTSSPFSQSGITRCVLDLMKRYLSVASLQEKCCMVLATLTEESPETVERVWNEQVRSLPR